MSGPWQVVPHAELAERVRACAGETAAQPLVIAVNGHSSSGKTTLADRLAGLLPGAAVLHTDDLAWHQGVFAWDVLLLEEVLPVVRAGRPLAYCPPQWIARGREGQITLPGDLDVLLVEGVGASQASVRAAYDVVIWVETEEMTRVERDLPRVAAGELDTEGYLSWMAEENAYVVTERPWQHADLIVTGGALVPHDPTTEIPLLVPT